MTIELGTGSAENKLHKLAEHVENMPTGSEGITIPMRTLGTAVAGSSFIISGAYDATQLAELEPDARALLRHESVNGYHELDLSARFKTLLAAQGGTKGKYWAEIAFIPEMELTINASKHLNKTPIMMLNKWRIKDSSGATLADNGFQLAYPAYQNSYQFYIAAVPRHFTLSTGVIDVANAHTWTLSQFTLIRCLDGELIGFTDEDINQGGRWIIKKDGITEVS